MTVGRIGAVEIGRFVVWVLDADEELFA